MYVNQFIIERRSRAHSIIHYASPIYLKVLAECRHKIVRVCLVGLAVSLKDGYTRGLLLREQMKCFHERELQLLDAGVEVLFAAESASVL